MEPIRSDANAAMQGHAPQAKPPPLQDLGPTHHSAQSAQAPEPPTERRPTRTVFWLASAGAMLAAACLGMAAAVAWFVVFELSAYRRGKLACALWASAAAVALNVVVMEVVAPPPGSLLAKAIPLDAVWQWLPAPQNTAQAQRERQARHTQQVHAVHPDARQLVASKAFVLWSQSLDAQRQAQVIQILHSGSAQEMADVLTEFKQRTPAAATPAVSARKP